MKLKQKFFAVLSFSVLAGGTGYASTYQDGDLIFQESQSPQSKAIQEATGSRWSHVGILFQNEGHWFVGEAIQPVRVTPLAVFISRGKNQSYRVERVPALTNIQKSALRTQAKSFLGKNYDIYFEWSDDLIYCSEFVYKTFRAALGIEVGVVQKFRDLNLNGPYVKELIRRRLADTGRNLNLEESIVTPASQIADPQLEVVEQSE